MGIALSTLFNLTILCTIIFSAIFLIAAAIFRANRFFAGAALFLAVFFAGAALCLNSNILPQDHISNFIQSDARKNILLRGIVIDDPITKPAFYHAVRTSFILKTEAISRRGGLNLPYGIIIDQLLLETS
jgi:ABC-type uncharacterized transport system permease subunit